LSKGENIANCAYCRRQIDTSQYIIDDLLHQLKCLNSAGYTVCGAIEEISEWNAVNLPDLDSIELEYYLIDKQSIRITNLQNIQKQPKTHIFKKTIRNSSNIGRKGNTGSKGTSSKGMGSKSNMRRN
jgi:hypothetical protein